MTTLGQRLRSHFSSILLLFIGVLLPLMVFGSLAEEVLEKEAFPIDRTILLFMHGHASSVHQQVMVFFTRAGSALALVPFNTVIFIFLWRRRRHNAATFWALATVGAAGLNWLAKNAFMRVRPDLWISSLPETTYSFPSGHAMQSAAVVTALIMLAWPTRWRLPMLVAGLVFMVLVGTSRVYLGVHFPSDILAGWAASLAWVTGLSLVFRRRFSKPFDYLAKAEWSK
ncbi:MAG: phosphatase PAP2 family protein [Janthinobacterium lividum]